MSSIESGDEGTTFGLRLARELEQHGHVSASLELVRAVTVITLTDDTLLRMVGDAADQGQACASRGDRRGAALALVAVEFAKAVSGRAHPGALLEACGVLARVNMGSTARVTVRA